MAEGIRMCWDGLGEHGVVSDGWVGDRLVMDGLGIG